MNYYIDKFWGNFTLLIENLSKSNSH